MPDQTGTIEQIALELAGIVSSAGERLDETETLRTLGRLGVRFPPQLLNHSGFDTARQATVDAALAVEPAVDALIVAADGGDAADIVAGGLEVLARVAATIATFMDLIPALRDAASTLPEVETAAVDALVDDLPRKLLDLLVVDQVDTIPGVGATLTVVGLIEREFVAGDSTDPTHPDFDRITVHYDRIISLISDPGAHFADLYDWGEPDFDGTKLLPVLHRTFTQLGLPALLRPASGGGDPMMLEAFAFDLTPTSGPDLPGLAIDVVFPVAGSLDIDLEIPHPDWTANLTADLVVSTGTSGTLMPPFDISLSPPEFTLSGSAMLSLIGAPASPFIIFGQPGGSRLEIARIAVGGGLEFEWDPGNGRADAVPEFDAELTGGKLLVSGDEGDGFLAQILSGININADLDLGMAWNAETGVRFRGSSALEIEIPLNRQLGPISIPSVYLGLGLGEEGVNLDLAASLGAQLGPLAAVVDRLGLRATLSFPEGGGNIGPAELELEFLPPNGVGMSLDGPLSGGGFLRFEPENERYSGIIELSFQDMFAISAIGLITTRLPDGEKGFSLLILISAEFSPIQLGLGFTLNGVGGLLGLNRSVNVDKLREGIRNNTLDHILFPVNPVANAPRIISDLRTIFPPYRDQFLIGPMAKIGWGTPTLVTVELGLIIEVPEPVRIALLGVLKASLPDEDAAILKLQVNFLGVVDFEAGYFLFEAALYDSRILTMSLSGGMAVYVRWKNESGFLVSVGGFHPAYDPPFSNMPQLERLMLCLLPGPNPRLCISAYFAVSSNTVQFGARVDLYVAVGKFNVKGWLGFDVLFQFSPFLFIALVEAGLAVRIGSTPILAVELAFALRGPTPYNAKGTAKFKILFFTFKVRFDKTFGREEEIIEPAIEGMPLLLAELQKNANWEALKLPRHSALVTLGPLPSAEELVVVQPNGRLAIRQKTIPLGLPIQKIGAAPVADGPVFDIDEVRAAGTRLPIECTREEFAPAQFLELSDEEKIGRKSFENFCAGMATQEAELIDVGPAVTRIVEYEQEIIDRRIFRPPFKLPLTVGNFLRFVRGNSVSRSQIAGNKRSPITPLAPPKVSVVEEGYSVVSTEDLRPVGERQTGLTQTEAIAQMQAMISTGQASRSAVQVVPGYQAVVDIDG